MTQTQTQMLDLGREIARSSEDAATRAGEAVRAGDGFGSRSRPRALLGVAGAGAPSAPADRAAPDVRTSPAVRAPLVVHSTSGVRTAPDVPAFPGARSTPVSRITRTSRTAETPRAKSIRARRPLTRDDLGQIGEMEPTDRILVGHLRELWDLAAQESRDLAARHRCLARLWQESPRDPDAEDPMDLVELQVAAALRTTRGRAGALVRDAHRAVDLHPLTFALLAEGLMPAEWFSRVLRLTGDLQAEDAALLDRTIATWDMGITGERFRRELSVLLTWIREVRVEPEQTPEQLRRVTTFAREDGTATLSITGPIPEVLSLSRRLDVSARALQVRQRRALETGEPVPFDDGSAASTGRAMTLDALRYAVMTRSVLETGGVEVPADRFRISVVVPALTLLGVADAPGLLDGVTPVPAEMARALAGTERVWHRILTDPSTGAFLPVPADRYRPTPAMLEHLRLRGAQCAAPGCTRSVSWASEADHIDEFDSRDPHRGGPTTLENLHLLCWAHHDMKTARRIDPVRRHDPPGRTTWHLGGDARLTVQDDVDLVTPLLVQSFLRAWAEHRERGRMQSAHPVPPPDAGPPPF